MACINDLTGDALFNCDDRPVKGIDAGKAVIINYKDIDFGTTTVSGATVSNLQLKTGTTGYKLEWYKELASSNSSFSPNAEDIDGFAQSFLGRLAVTSANNAERAKELSAGRFVVVYESRYKGVGDAEAFKVLGLESGLELSEMTTNTNENSSSILFTLATKEGTYEQYPYQILNETTYATSKASFDALFTAVV